MILLKYIRRSYCPACHAASWVPCHGTGYGGTHSTCIQRAASQWWWDTIGKKNKTKTEDTEHALQQGNA